MNKSVVVDSTDEVDDVKTADAKNQVGVAHQPSEQTIYSTQTHVDGSRKRYSKEGGGGVGGYANPTFNVTSAVNSARSPLYVQPSVPSIRKQREMREAAERAGKADLMVDGVSASLLQAGQE